MEEVKINCETCKKNCCENPELTPVLLPHEEEMFRKSSRVIDTDYGDVYVLKKKNDGSCIFLDSSKKCSIYESRPIECKIYPYLLKFIDDEPELFKDRRFCKGILEGSLDEEKVLKEIREFKFPLDWIGAYESLIGL